MGGVLPAAGIASTAADMARFAAFLLDERDGPVLSAQSRREMMRVQAVFPDWTGGQGLGFELRRTGDGTRIGHAGRAAGFAARFDIDPAHHLGVVILTNADDGAPTRLVDRALALPAPVVDAGRPAPPIDPSWQRYVGTFVHKEGSNAFALVDGRLAWVDPGAAEPARTRIFLDPAGPDRFRFASGGLIGEIVTFQTDPAGRVIGVQAGGTLYWKQ